jgi:hypothetical protein
MVLDSSFCYLVNCKIFILDMSHSSISLFHSNFEPSLLRFARCMIVPDDPLSFLPLTTYEIESMIFQAQV